jgi:hypothetical protein
MGRRRSSGFFETLFKSVFSTGTTVHRTKNWLGQRVTVVKHHDTGKTKKYTHGTGFFGTTTRTETRDGSGRVVERGKLKKTLILGTPVENAEKQDGSGRTVKRKYGQGFFGNKMTTQTYDGAGAEVGNGQTKPSLFFGATRTEYTGTCYGCDGTGTRTFDCRNCQGSGTYQGQCRLCAGSGQYQPASKPCRLCGGSGRHGTASCRRCSGTGQWVAPASPCKKCNASGQFSAKCRKCDGTGQFKATCKKCSGSGVFRKGS